MKFNEMKWMSDIMSSHTSGFQFFASTLSLSVSFCLSQGAISIDLEVHHKMKNEKSALTIQPTVYLYCYSNSTFESLQQKWIKHELLAWLEFIRSLHWPPTFHSKLTLIIQSAKKIYIKWKTIAFNSNECWMHVESYRPACYLVPGVFILIVCA